jgi:hypothetical protein
MALNLHNIPSKFECNPKVVEEGTIITVDGRFHRAPFGFEEMRAPHMEIPLARYRLILI